MKEGSAGDKSFRGAGVPGKSGIFGSGSTVGGAIFGRAGTGATRALPSPAA